MGTGHDVPRPDSIAVRLQDRIRSGIRAFYLLQVLISGTALSVVIWDGVSYIKEHLDRNDELYPWTFNFYHPTDSGIYNYVLLCLVLGLAGISLYFIVSHERIRGLLKRLEAFHPAIIISTVLLSAAGLAAALMNQSMMMEAFICAFLAGIPFLFLFHALLDREQRFRIELATLGVVVGAAWLIVVIDLWRIIAGPVYLMNEFPDISSKTIMGSRGGYTVDNREFLRMNEDKIDIPTMYIFMEILNNSNENLKDDFKERIHKKFNKYSYKNLRPAQRFINEVGKDPASADSLMGNQFMYDVLKKMNLDADDFFQRLSRFDIEDIKQFYLKNVWEYSHINMGRGQLNHIGHILNPINEYQLGKPLKDIYLQYGLGNTFLLKWVMELFGGVSIQNYYKVYIFYIIYYLSFIAMLIYLFKDTFYVLAGSLALLLSFFFSGYLGLILAPGVIPSIHLFDAPVLLLMIVFLRRGSMAGLVFAAVLVFLGLALNRQFGAVLGCAFLASVGLFALENRSGKKRILWLLGLGVVAAVSGIILKITAVTSANGIFPYFLGGFFSWKPSELIMVCSFVYLVLSYSFFYFLKSDRSDLKYAYVFIFVYSQGLLVYYYWSGLTNHFHPISHYIYLQGFLMLYILKHPGNRFMQLKKDFPLRLAMAAALIAALVMLPLGVYKYTTEKFGFQRNFRNHTLYQWNFDKARVLSTADPEMVARSVSLIRKYSTESAPAVFILSKHDNVLPFLSHRYSAMPIFELSSYLFSRKESDIAVAEIRERKPEYLFVDANMDGFRKDPWESIFFGDFMERERLSRLGRYAVMADIFHEVEADYIKIEQGGLLTVYKRKATKVPAY